MSRRARISLAWIFLVLLVLITSAHMNEVNAVSRVVGFFLPGSLLVLVLLSLTTIRKRRQKLRRLHGLCLSCGYDLRASPDRCPECGTPTTRPHPRPS
jgi:predicted Zn-ribbon and HTH transcriptional regulator